MINPKAAQFSRSCSVGVCLLGVDTALLGQVGPLPLGRVLVPHGRRQAVHGSFQIRPPLGVAEARVALLKPHLHPAKRGRCCCRDPSFFRWAAEKSSKKRRTKAFWSNLNIFCRGLHKWWAENKDTHKNITNPCGWDYPFPSSSRVLIVAHLMVKVEREPLCWWTDFGGL